MYPALLAQCACICTQLGEFFPTYHLLFVTCGRYIWVLAVSKNRAFLQESVERGLNMLFWEFIAHLVWCGVIEQISLHWSPGFEWFCRTIMYLNLSWDAPFTQQALSLHYQGCWRASSHVYLFIGSFSIRWQMKSLAARGLKQKKEEKGQAAANPLWHVSRCFALSSSVPTWVWDVVPVRRVEFVLRLENLLKQLGVVLVIKRRISAQSGGR